MDLGSVFHPELVNSEIQTRICTLGLLRKIELIFIKSEELSIIKVNDSIDFWLHETQIWKKNGFSSIFVENMMNFLNKKSVVIDDSVFLISTSICEGQTGKFSQSQGNGKNLGESQDPETQSFKGLSLIHI